jgi:hypothetical protein
MTIEDRKQIVIASIERIRAAHQHHLDVSMDATSTGKQRAVACERIVACEREFGWQWENVAMILKMEPNTIDLVLQCRICGAKQ